MTTTDKQQLQSWVFAFAETEDGEWLKTFDWKAIPVDWSDRCNADNGIMGAYMLGKIWLMECSCCLDMIFPTYVHELYHRWQWLNNPLKYLLGKLYRPIIEDPADEMTEAAEDWMEAHRES